MALINCPDCNKEVSTSAVSCPNCGAPVAAAQETEAAGTPLTTTQSTSKKFKGQQVIATLMFIVGAVWIFAALGQEPPSEAGVTASDYARRHDLVYRHSHPDVVASRLDARQSRDHMLV